jgi:SNF2 family DNA or RNA helicase
MEYFESTWETASLLENENYSDKVADYKQRTKRRRVLEATKGDKPPLRSFKEFDVQPEYLPHRLYPYQLRGLNWLRKCWYDNVNNILADEMGLGKTIQAITFCLSLRENKEVPIDRPFLIIVPLSVVSNWLREFHTWAPYLNVVAYAGNEQSRSMIRSVVRLSFAAPSDLTLYTVENTNSSCQTRRSPSLTF